MFSTIIVTDMCGILPCFIVMASNVHNVYNVRKKEMHTKHFIEFTTLRFMRVFMCACLVNWCQSARYSNSLRFLRAQMKLNQLRIKKQLFLHSSGPSQARLILVRHIERVVIALHRDTTNDLCQHNHLSMTAWNIAREHIICAPAIGPHNRHTIG